ncbi:MAG: DUF1722 domain-containing protein [Pseudolactococcus raffinolactis]|jgi:uncharacterized protein YbgA (DUF1722 family)|uniref:YbgA family protein n=1 Tax=Pseudolactococcus raffinolactis TaxID=1366 RepID=UPI001C704636|nr:YbgA family protein [Lactococcus raffinolactis]MBW9297891.1 DUF1722 domain-containing protein [Lactococcus raffinolactis]MCH4161853.1 YbgA family protein [Lactococcus raffinolactis]
MTAWQVKWAEHKYWVMAHSQQLYNQIRVLAKNNDWSDEIAVTFENLLQEAALQVPTRKTLTTAYEHVWGYFKKIATPEEKNDYLRRLAVLEVDNDQLGSFLKNLTLKYQVTYLMHSRLIREIQEEQEKNETLA